jgi:hypothetical protein
MNKPDNNYSRLNRKRGRNRSDKILNILIAVVVLAIIITASIIFMGGDNKNKAEEKLPDTTEENSEDGSTSEVTDGTATDDAASEDESADSTDESATDETETDETTETGEEADPGVVKYESSEDAVVNESIIKTGWEPIGTKQTGEHVSLYDGKSVDWQEKISAISYATDLPEDALIIWKIKNGGSPQKSIGIVSTKDKVEKYRVYLEWIDGKGWKPVKMDVLNTLDFDY